MVATSTLDNLDLLMEVVSLPEESRTRAGNPILDNCVSVAVSCYQSHQPRLPTAIRRA